MGKADRLYWCLVTMMPRPGLEAGYRCFSLYWKRQYNIYYWIPQWGAITSLCYVYLAAGSMWTSNKMKVKNVTVVGNMHGKKPGWNTEMKNTIEQHTALLAKTWEPWTFIHTSTPWQSKARNFTVVSAPLLFFSTLLPFSPLLCPSLPSSLLCYAPVFSLLLCYAPLFPPLLSSVMPVFSALLCYAPVISPLLSSVMPLSSFPRLNTSPEVLNNMCVSGSSHAILHMATFKGLFLFHQAKL